MTSPRDNTVQILEGSADGPRVTALAGRRLLEVYQFMVRYTQEHDGLPPTIRTVMRAVRLRTTSAVFHHLDRLVQLGLVERAVTDDGGHIYQVRGGSWAPPSVSVELLDEKVLEIIWPEPGGASASPRPGPGS